jgi:hypothetical protein
MQIHCFMLLVLIIDPNAKISRIFAHTIRHVTPTRAPFKMPQHKKESPMPYFAQYRQMFSNVATGV